MAELHFFAESSDLEQIVDLLIGRYEARFVLDGGPVPQPDVHQTVRGVMEAVAKSRFDSRFFVLSPRWQRQELFVDETIHKDGRQAFYIRQRYGGPAFDFIMRKRHVNDSPPWLVASSLSDYPWYYVRANDPGTMPRPEAMTRAFAEVKRLVSKQGMRSKVKETEKVGPWILQSALHGQRNGLWLRIGDWHHVPRGC